MAGTLAPFREWHETSPLRRHVRSTYVTHIPRALAPFELRVLPDCFVDILWGPAGRLRVAGPDTRFRRVVVPAGDIVAVRFRRAAARALLGVPLSELADARVPLEDLWGDDARWLADRLEACSSSQAALLLLRTALLARLPGAPPQDGLARAAAASLQRSPATRITDLATTLGVSERHLRRRMRAAVGLGPKTLQRIFRVQRFLRLGRAAGYQRPIAELASLSGFVDQAHLTNECVHLMGFTPVSMLRMQREPTAVG